MDDRLGHGIQRLAGGPWSLREAAFPAGLRLSARQRDSACRMRALEVEYQVDPLARPVGLAGTGS